jgi:hypothetical protein
MTEADSILAGERSRNRPDRIVNAFAPGYVIAESDETNNTMCIMTFTNAPGVPYFASIRFLITNHLSPTFHQSWPMKSTAAPASPLTNHFSFITAALAEAESLTSISRDSRRSKFRRKIVVNLKSPGLQKKQFLEQTSRPSYSL